MTSNNREAISPQPLDMNNGSIDDDHPARSAVFGTLELLKAIIVHLPFLEIIRCQRVAKIWKSSVLKSTEIEEKLFLRPHGRVETWHYHMEGKNDGTGWVSHTPSWAGKFFHSTLAPKQVYEYWRQKDEIIPALLESAHFVIAEAVNPLFTYEVNRFEDGPETSLNASVQDDPDTHLTPGGKARLGIERMLDGRTTGLLENMYFTSFPWNLMSCSLSFHIGDIEVFSRAPSHRSPVCDLEHPTIGNGVRAILDFCTDHEVLRRHRPKPDIRSRRRSIDYTTMTIGKNIALRDLIARLKEHTGARKLKLKNCKLDECNTFTTDGLLVLSEEERSLVHDAKEDFRASE